MSNREPRERIDWDVPMDLQGPFTVFVGRGAGDYRGGYERSHICGTFDDAVACCASVRESRSHQSDAWWQVACQEFFFLRLLWEGRTGEPDRDLRTPRQVERIELAQLLKGEFSAEQLTPFLGSEHQKVRKSALAALGDATPPRSARHRE